MAESSLSERIGATIKAARAKAAEEAARAKSGARDAGAASRRAARKTAKAGKQGARAGKAGTKRTVEGARRTGEAVSESADTSKYVDKRRKGRQSEMFERAERAGHARAPVDASFDAIGDPGGVERLARGSVDSGDDRGPEPGREPGVGGMLLGIGGGLHGSGAGGGGMEALVTGNTQDSEPDDGDGDGAGGEGGWLSFEDSFGLGGGDR